MPSQLHDFCWGALYHMLGVTPEDKITLEGAGHGDDRSLCELAKVILEYERAHQELGKAQPAVSEPALRLARALRQIVKLAGDVLSPQLGTGRPCLSSECPAHAEVGACNDHYTAGFSRNPFKPVRPAHAGLLALATVVYLLRSHALFFCRPKSLRNYDAAKVALNDIHQAYHLAWRLYHSLGTNHHEAATRRLSHYYEAVLTRCDDRGNPGASEYFVFNLLMLCDMFRGNIHYQIDYIEEAERHYRRAHDRFSELWFQAAKGNRSLDAAPLLHWFVTPTMVKVLSERSKTQFDLGRFLDSLRNQLRSIEFVVRLSDVEPGLPQVKRLVSRLAELQDFIDAERASPVFDRERITQLFGDPCAATPEWGGGAPGDILKPADMIPVVRPEFAHLTAQILARVGFTLYTIRPRFIARGAWDQATKARFLEDKRKRKEWLQPYFQFDEIWKTRWTADSSKWIRPSDLGMYCMTLFDFFDLDERKKDTKERSIFPENIERRYALLLRELLKREDVGREPFAGDMLEELDFYRAILTTTTQNIANLVTIPRRNGRMLFRRGYRHRRTEGDLSQSRVDQGLEIVLGERKAEKNAKSPVNKLVVLRRWQSFNPKIPKPSGRHIRGGGYFLLWQKRGIIIDPGYDFLQNFYEEGFSFEDVDAIVVTHSHPDHDDDLSSIITLVREWNEFHERIGQRDRQRMLDLFLNESAQRKFSAWLQASDVKFGRIIPLPGLRWNKDTARPADGKPRGKNVQLSLRPEAGDAGYDLSIEVVPAWHDDVIGKTVAVGLKFHLLDAAGHEVGLIGYTGDTGAYGLDVLGNDEPNPDLRIDGQFADCDILIAHLGDIRLPELATVMARHGFRWDRPYEPHPLIRLLDTWFNAVPPDRRHERVRDFLDFVVTLNLSPSAALQIPVHCVDGEQRTLEDWLGGYVEGRATPESWRPREDWRIDGAFRHYVEECLKRDREHVPANIESIALVRIHRELAREDIPVDGDELFIYAYQMLALLSACTLIPWQYPYHLGIFGIYRLFMSMAHSEPKRPGRVFIVGELPEELASYRHMVAHWLNVSQIPRTTPGDDRRPRAFTGDIGLHIGLEVPTDWIAPSIRCTFCNYNNEIVCERSNYHVPDQIYETPIKRLEGAMIYLCKARDHHPECAERPRHFLSRPELREI